MIENIIGWLLIGSAVVILLAAPIVIYKKHAREQAERNKRREQALQQLKQARADSWAAVRRRAKEEPTATSYTTQPSDDFLTNIVLNAALNSNSGTVSASVDYDNNTVSVREESAPRSSWDSIGEDTSSKTSSSYSSSSSWSSSSSSDIRSSSSWDSSSSSDSSSSWD